MADEKLTTKEQWYDLKQYKDEVRQFVIKKRLALYETANLEKTFRKLYRAAYAGTEESDTERYTHTAELFKVYKSALIEACLPGYTALYDAKGLDGYSTLKIPELDQTMTQQFKSMALIEDLSGETLDDWILKGEAAGFLKLKENREEYRIKETIQDAETGQDLVKFKLIEGVEYEDLEFERIDPLDLYIDAYDYKRDPLGCPKIVRSFIDAKTLLTSNAYPLLSKEDKEAIINKEIVKENSPLGGFYSPDYMMMSESYSRSAEHQIEVLTFRGDYITNDHKVLSNIVATVVDNRIADIKYSEVSTNRLIYAAYKVDRQTRRGVSPLASGNPINKLMNRAIDMFIKNLDDISNPYVLYQKGTINKAQLNDFYKEKKLEYIEGQQPPQFWSPPPAATTGLDLLRMIVDQNKNTLGLNAYMAGDATGAVRTARESSILFQKANARMRVETDVFSYKFMLRFITAFYSFNRELALAADHPLAEIYSDPRLKISISTNAAKADSQGELNMLMQILNLPIAQMIFSNLTPQQTVLAVRYLMAKAGLKDVDNLLELEDEEGNTVQLPAMDKEGNFVEEVPPPQAQANEQNNLPPTM